MSLPVGIPVAPARGPEDPAAMAAEVQTLICTALAARARQLRDMGNHAVEADKTADLGRMVKMLADPVPLAAVLGLT